MASAATVRRAVAWAFLAICAGLVGTWLAGGQAVPDVRPKGVADP